MKLKKILNKFKEQVFIADLLLIVAFFIVFFTTLSLNVHLAMYLLAIGLTFLSYIIQKSR